MSSRLDPNGTGPYQPSSEGGSRSRPSMKTGFAILLAGTLIGGVIGITSRARQNDAEAALAAQQQQITAQPEVSAAAAAPTSAASAPAASPAATPTAPPSAPVPVTTVIAPPAAAAAAASAAPAASAAVALKEPKKGHAVARGAAAGFVAHAPLAAKAPPVVKEKEPPKERDSDDGYKTASADPTAKEPKPEPKETKAPPKDTKAEAKEAKAEPKEPKEPKDGSKKQPKAGGGSKAADDAVNVLRAAMGATENTL
jgi:hypothetical protein